MFLEIYDVVLKKLKDVVVDTQIVRKDGCNLLGRIGSCDGT